MIPEPVANDGPQGETIAELDTLFAVLLDHARKGEL